MIKQVKNIIYKHFSRWYWASSFALKWHKSRDQNDFKIFADAIYEISSTRDKKFNNIIEIGCGSGELVYYLSQTPIQCNNIIGIDINKKQIKRNNDNYKQYNNINFYHTDIEDYVGNIGDNTLIVSHNTLDYFKPDRLKSIFSTLYKKNINLTILITNRSSLLLLEDSVINTQHNFMNYHHNYYKLLTAVGYHTTYTDFPKNSPESIIVIATTMKDS